VSRERKGGVVQAGWAGMSREDEFGSRSPKVRPANPGTTGGTGEGEGK
jgi:hypothetical protein